MLKRKMFLFLISVALGPISLPSCTTAQSVYDQAPSYVVKFSNVDTLKLATCADGIFNEKHESAYYSVIKGGDPYVIEHWWRLKQLAPMFISKFYMDRVEINGRFNVWGDYGELYIPIVKECLARMGGNVIGEV
ncbi:hypothetical protein [Hyphococcus sp.]|uniref:hypothetical protein n=1 Tax=Hyphococcus sp. TaxID=2038636 RepID=UPI003CCBD24F